MITRVTMTGAPGLGRITRRSRVSTEEARSQEAPVRVKEAEARVRAWPTETGRGLGRESEDKDRTQTLGTTIKIWMGTNQTTIKMTRTLASDRDVSRIMTAIRGVSDLGVSLVTTTPTDREETLEASPQARIMAPLLPTDEVNSREETLVDSNPETTLEDSRLGMTMVHLTPGSASSRMETLVACRRTKITAPQALTLVASRDREALLLDSRQERIMGLHHQTGKEATLVDSSREVTSAANRLVRTMAPLQLTSGDSSREATLVEAILVASRLIMTMAPLGQTSMVSRREKTWVDNSRVTTSVDNKLEKNMAHLDQTTGGSSRVAALDKSREETLVDNSREATLEDNSRVILLVDNRLERNMAPLNQVDSSQAATLVDSQEEVLVDNNKEAAVRPSLAPRELTDSPLREFSQARTTEPQSSDLRTSQLHLILS